MTHTQFKYPSIVAQRPALKGRALLLCLCSFVSTTTLGGYQAVSPSYDLSGIPSGSVRLLTPEQHAFQVGVEALAGASTVTALGKLAPMCFFISNTSGKVILALTVRYDITDIAGRSYVWEFQREGISGRTGNFAPNASYLITPSGTLTELLYRRADSRAIAAEAAGFSSESFQKIETVVISVDSIVFDDGLFLGKDRSESLARFNDFLRAQRDLLDELQAVPKSIDEIETLLRSKTERPSAAQETRDFYGRRQHLLAQVLLARLRHGGRAALEDEIRLLTSNQLALRKGM